MLDEDHNFSASLTMIIITIIIITIIIITIILSSLSLGGRFVQLEDTIKGFNEILSGKLDSLPEGKCFLAAAL